MYYSDHERLSVFSSDVTGGGQAFDSDNFNARVFHCDRTAGLLYYMWAVLLLFKSHHKSGNRSSKLDGSGTGGASNSSSKSIIPHATSSSFILPPSMYPSITTAPTHSL